MNFPPPADYVAALLAALPKRLAGRVTAEPTGPATVRVELDGALGGPRMFKITFSNGHTDTAETYADALARVYRDYPDGFAVDNNDRTLVWADEASSEDDDGARAVASIYPPVEVPS